LKGLHERYFRSEGSKNVYIQKEARVPVLIKPSRRRRKEQVREKGSSIIRKRVLFKCRATRSIVGLGGGRIYARAAEVKQDGKSFLYLPTEKLDFDMYRGGNGRGYVRN